MENQLFKKPVGSEKLQTPTVTISLILLCGFVGLGIGTQGILIGVVVIGLPFVIFFLTVVFKKQYITIYSALYMAFLALGVVRYVPAPLGLSIDILLLLGWLAFFFEKFDKTDWTPLKNGYSAAVLIWFGWVVFEIINPEARSKVAWFFAMRGIGLYSLMTIPLCFLVFNTTKHQKKFVDIWFTLAIIGTIWGCRQLYIGLDGAENRWLAAGNDSTHILHGKLRVFSFYTDAGQFGASQAHTFLVSAIMAMGPFTRKRKIFYGIAAAFTFWGMMISGTRGALFVPVAGFFIYFVLTKNIKILFLGLLFGVGAFVFLKYTKILQGNYQVARMRTALDPNDASFQVRLENQKKLKSYLASRPIGGGVGSAGYWGLRFSPGTFLAETPTDSWYVQIWAENGVIGLYLYVAMIIYLIGKGFLIIWFLKDEKIKQYAMALFSGFFGIAFASYGNKVLGQMPTGLLVYISISLIYMSKMFDNKKQEEEKKAIQSGSEHSDI